MGHLVVSSAELEAKDGEEILPLQHHPTFESVAQVHGMLKRSFTQNFVDAGREDQPEILYS